MSDIVLVEYHWKGTLQQSYRCCDQNRGEFYKKQGDFQPLNFINP